jgi:rRNA pseudouridine-1189 N-methylase Emg1 (Nep1/Mra1 family)
VQSLDNSTNPHWLRFEIKNIWLDRLAIDDKQHTEEHHRGRNESADRKILLSSTHHHEFAHDQGSDSAARTLA